MILLRAATKRVIKNPGIKIKIIKTTKNGSSKKIIEMTGLFIQIDEKRISKQASFRNEFHIINTKWFDKSNCK